MKYRIDNLSVPKKNPFANDDLERQPLVNFLSDLIKRLNGPFVLALDSPFGMGKTTLVHMLMENLMCEGHQCTYFNAWEVDFATDPLVALISSIDRIGLNSSEGETEFVQQFQKVKDLTTVLAKPSIIAATKLLTSGAIDLEEIITAISSASKVDGKGEAVEEFNQEFELLDKFRDELKIAIELLPTTNNTISLVIFVDELDRCRPTFAIHLLERIKHLFDIPNILFVLSIDKKQIEASTKAVYGADFNATEYLRRFFDLEYGIPTPDTQLYTDKLISRFDLDANFDERTHPEIQYDRKHFVEYFDLLANAMNLSLRARERCITRLRIVMDNTPSDQYLKPVLVALLIILRSNLPDLYTQIINGEASPEDVIGKLNSLSGGKFEQSENFVTVIHAYLLIADPDRERAQNRGKELVREAKDRGEDSYAASLLRMKQIILQNNRSHMPIDEIAKKVDLVSWVRK